PGGLEDAPLAVRQSSGYRAGEALELLPGVAVRADPTEIPGFDAAEATDRIAGVLVERLVTGGAGSARGLVTDAGFGRQLDRAFAGPVPQLVQAQLGAALLPAGLGDGS